MDHLNIGTAQVKPSSCVRNLGSWFDTQLNMKQHVSKFCGAAFYHLHNLRRIRKYLSISTTVQLVHALISCRLDYCNSLLYGLPSFTTNKLQRVQNAAARLVSESPRFSHITPILFDLHWLPIPYRIIFKILLITYKAVHGQCPKYIQDLIIRKEKGRYLLRSDDEYILERPNFRSLATLGDRSFYVAAPTLWNKLPYTIRSSPHIDYFKQQLKTHLFTLAFDTS